MMLNLYNTLSRRKEVFKPIKRGAVGFYACGPTVYSNQHLGNYRTFILNDLLKRALVREGYRVKHIMNVTDVGHLTGDNLGDADVGKDRIEESAKREGKSALEVAKYYTDAFLGDLRVLNILSPTKLVKATAHIKEMIALIRTLEKKGYTYTIKDGVYFDTSKFKSYGKLSQQTGGKRAGARVEPVAGKKNPADFALWKFSKPNEKRQMEWKSQWGVGFPGWHIECSAMSMRYLGKTFEIHSGGEDHIAIHHENEIAQSEAATGKQFVKYWVHGRFMMVDGKRMGKSEGNAFVPQDLVTKGYNPLSFRYLALGSHYRARLNFTWEALSGAQSALHKLYHDFALFGFIGKESGKKGDTKKYEKAFFASVNDDLNISKALAVVHELIADNKVSAILKRKLLLEFDNILGLGLNNSDKLAKPPAEIRKLVVERERSRIHKQFTKADTLRAKIEKLGYIVEDTSEGPFVWPTKM